VGRRAVPDVVGLASRQTGARSPFEAQQLPPDSSRKLITMGFLTSALNPKIAVFYLSVFPQFITPEHGSVFTQSIMLGLTQISVSFSVNLLIACSLRASPPGSSTTRPGWRCSAISWGLCCRRWRCD